MRRVKPTEMLKAHLNQIPDGAIFTHNGVRYIKLSSDRGYGRGVFVTTLLPSCTLPSNCMGVYGRSLEERIVEAFIDNICFTTHPDVITYGVADADDYRAYADILRNHIKDCWYVDMGVEDSLKEGEYFYIDEFGNLEKGNEMDEKIDSVVRTIGLRAMYWFDPESVVLVPAGKDMYWWFEPDKKKG